MVYNTNDYFYGIFYKYDCNSNKKNISKYCQELQRRFESETIPNTNLKNYKFGGP